MTSTRTALIALTAIATAAPALADVTISTDTTQNMSCSGGVCEPTAADAVLNVNDLESYLASGNVEVTTTGSGVEADNIRIEAALTWSNASALSLVATQAVTVDEPVSVTGGGGLAVTTDGQNEDFSFGKIGHFKFFNLSSTLTINGASYTLVKTVQSLANAIAANPSGDYALAANYDAGRDGVYEQTPVPTPLRGSLNGLGNSISKLHANGGRVNSGLFLTIESGGSVANLTLAALRVGRQRGLVGGLVEDNLGTITRCSTSGKLRGQAAGGLAGENSGTIARSQSTANFEPGTDQTGGLVVYNSGVIDQSFATGYGTEGADDYPAGGLVAENDGSITDSYATGAVVNGLAVGGLVGSNPYGSTVSTSYSTGQVTGCDYSDCYTGGFIGTNYGSSNDGYWDTTTSGTNTGVGGGDSLSGVTGLTTTQLQSGLPTGFDPSVWAEDSTINNGLPYLIANPPPN